MLWVQTWGFFFIYIRYIACNGKIQRGVLFFFPGKDGVRIETDPQVAQRSGKARRQAEVCTGFTGVIEFYPPHTCAAAPTTLLKVPRLAAVHTVRPYIYILYIYIPICFFSGAGAFTFRYVRLSVCDVMAFLGGALSRICELRVEAAKKVWSAPLITAHRLAALKLICSSHEAAQHIRISSARPLRTSSIVM